MPFIILSVIHREKWQSARRDFQHYLELQPDAVDREEVGKQIRAIQRFIAQVN